MTTGADKVLVAEEASDKEDSNNAEEDAVQNVSGTNFGSIQLLTPFVEQMEECTILGRPTKQDHENVSFSREEGRNAITDSSTDISDIASDTTYGDYARVGGTEYVTDGTECGFCLSNVSDTCVHCGKFVCDDCSVITTTTTIGVRRSQFCTCKTCLETELP